MSDPTFPNQNPGGGRDLSQYRLQIKEQWLREEIRAARALAFGVMQGGTTVLAAVTSFLYFIRRDITQHLIQIGRIVNGGLMPWPRWFLGTAFLLLIAYIFYTLVKYLTEKVIKYREQLIAMAPTSFSGITENHPAVASATKYTYILLFAFPIIDAVLYFAFSIARSFNVPW